MSVGSDWTRVLRNRGDLNDPELMAALVARWRRAAAELRQAAVDSSHERGLREVAATTLVAAAGELEATILTVWGPG